MLRHLLQTLLLRHRRATRHAGDNHALTHAGQREFRPQRRRRAAEAGYPRRVVPENAQLVQGVHLLPDGSVQAGVPGVQAHNVRV